MSETTARNVVVFVIIVVIVGLFFATIDIMQKHPCISWYIFGMVTIIGVEAIIYLIYLLIRYIREQREKPPNE